MNAVTLLVLTLAAYRLTTLVTTDSITRPLRHWVIRKVNPEPTTYGPLNEGRNPRNPHPIVVLIGCGRCLGFWMSGATVAVARACEVDLGGIPWVLVWWAVAGGVTLLATLAP